MQFAVCFYDIDNLRVPSSFTSVEQLLMMDEKAETGMLNPLKWAHQKASCQTVDKSDCEPLFPLIVSHSE